MTIRSVTSQFAIPSVIAFVILWLVMRALDKRNTFGVAELTNPKATTT